MAKWRRCGTLVAVCGLALGACSGGENASTDTPVPTRANDQDGSDTSAPTSGDDDTPTTVAEVAETTVPPPEVIPLGVRWETVDSIPEVAKKAWPQSLVNVDDELWMFASRGNSTVVVRSLDDGLTWEQVPIVTPPGSGSQSVQSVVTGPDGRLVAWGAIGSVCQVNLDDGDGFRQVGICEKFRPVLYVSDDDGASWRQIEPPAMAPPGNTTGVIAGLVATPTGYLAAGTVKGDDWHVRLWSSPDGENWALDREIRGDAAPISARQLLANDDVVVLLADEHPCSTPSYNTPGWYLGANWVEHLRIYQGTNTGDLALLGAADHPFAHDPQPIVCNAGSDLDQIGELDALYPKASGAVVGDVVTMLEDVVVVEEPDDAEDAGEADPLSSGTRRIAELIDGVWVPTEIVGVQDPAQASGSELLDVAGLPGIMETHGNGRVRIDLVPILPDGDGAWYQRVPEQSVVANSVSSGAWSGGALIAAGMAYDAPYASSTPENARTLQVWRSVESTGSVAERCDLSPGGSCRFADLSLVDGYPDFAGLDLSGADLAFTDFGDADFTGANFTGATMWEITSGEQSTFEGADFSGARLPQAEIGNARGAKFDGANVSWSTVIDATGASFVGADLQFAVLSFSALPNLSGAVLKYAHLEMTPPAAGEPYEIALDGLDLTNAQVGTPWDVPRLSVLSVVGTILTGASFKNVDLTPLAPALVDLTDVDVWEDSLCPDGLAPDDPPIGTCVRGATP